MTAPAGASPRSWTLELPPGTPILTANQRMHYHERSDRVQALIGAVTLVVRLQRPGPFAGRVDVLAEYATPQRRKASRHPLASAALADADNLAPTVKAAVDALVRCGVLAGDSRAYVRRVSYQLAENTDPRGVVRITLTEVA